MKVPLPSFRKSRLEYLVEVFFQGGQVSAVGKKDIRLAIAVVVEDSYTSGHGLWRVEGFAHVAFEMKWEIFQPEFYSGVRILLACRERAKEESNDKHRWQRLTGKLREHTEPKEK